MQPSTSISCLVFILVPVSLYIPLVSPSLCLTTRECFSRYLALNASAVGMSVRLESISIFHTLTSYYIFSNHIFCNSIFPDRDPHDLTDYQCDVMYVAFLRKNENSFQAQRVECIINEIMLHLWQLRFPVKRLLHSDYNTFFSD